MEIVKRFKTKEESTHLFSFEDRVKNGAPKCRKFQRASENDPWPTVTEMRACAYNCKELTMPLAKMSF